MSLKKRQITGLRKYFRDMAQKSTMHRVTAQADKGFTPLELSQDTPDETNPSGRDELTKNLQRWKEKSLHVRYAEEIEAEGIDKQASLKWLEKGLLFPETEGFLMAIQDQVINTNNYKKYIIKEQMESDKCRICNSKPETIQHIIAGCEKLAPTEYAERHDNLAKVLHNALARKYGLTEKKEEYYRYQPKKVCENERAKIYWDRTIMTNRTIQANRPDIVVIDKRAKTTHLIDIAVSNTNNCVKTVGLKREKYQELANEMQQRGETWKVTIEPVVILATGVTPIKTIQAVERLLGKGESTQTFEKMQKAAILATTRIVRKVIGDTYI